MHLRLVYNSRTFSLTVLSMVLEHCCKKELTAVQLQRMLFLEDPTEHYGIRPIRQRLSQIDPFQINHSYADEQRSLQLIRNGDVDRIQEQLGQYPIAYPSPVQDVRKNTEYMCVALLAVVSRAAIESGLPSADSFLYSDEFLKKISEAKSVGALLEILGEIRYTYAKLVRQVKLQSSHDLLVIKCKRLIQTNLLEPLSLSLLADRLDVSGEHLARRFKKETGMTVTQYILSKRFDLACDMLVHSNLTVNEIAQYLQFQSVSYFIRAFKKQKNITPNAYRKAHPEE